MTSCRILVYTTSKGGFYGFTDGQKYKSRTFEPLYSSTIRIVCNGNYYNSLLDDLVVQKYYNLFSGFKRNFKILSVQSHEYGLK